VRVHEGRLLTFATLPYFIGGFLGPFGTVIVIAIYPELRATFGADTATVNWSFSGYLLPMAALMLVSGTIGERFGRFRVTRIVFVTYAVASLAAAVAPTVELFIACRVAQGLANAFITPLLLAGLIEVMPPELTGRAVGIYSSFQAAGATAAPLAAGAFALFDWRWAFVLLAAVSLALTVRPAPGRPRPGPLAPPIRPLLTRRMAALWGAAFLAAAGPVGIPVVVGVYLRDDLDVGSAGAGAILAVAGAVIALTSPGWGGALDRWGAVRSAVIGLGAASAATFVLGQVRVLPLVVVVLLCANAANALTVVVIQHLAVVSVPSNRGGGASSVLSFRFAGHAIGPLALVPLVSRSPGTAFAIVAGLGLAAMGALVVAARPGR
jgi:ACDE family multidrug resistance protein